MALVAAALVVAFAIQRWRRPDPPTRPGGWPVPAQLDRNDFPLPEVAWLVAVFTSASCQSCAGVLAKASVLKSDAVAVAGVEVGERPDLHRRYGVEAVPITVVADASGVVRAAFVGPVTATDLWASVAEVREPGSSPEPQLGQPDAPSGTLSP